VTYTNHLVESIPWSIHVVQIERANSAFEFHSVHAGNSALGLSTLRTQVTSLSEALGAPVAAINGDFYQRDKSYAGDPRGLQIAEGELISAPDGGACFWVDPLGQPQATNVVSQFQITWPDGTTTPFGLNEDRRPGGVVLYTPTLGQATCTAGGRELVLERQGTGPWLPLEIGRSYRARVREIRETGNTTLAPDTMVLSLGQSVLAKLPKVEPGAVLRFTTASSPVLRGIKTAIGGGPVLVRAAKRQKIGASGPQDGEASSYAFSSMSERHPRSAIGWNQQWFFLVEVDGRQRELSVGMTLDELSAYLVKLGCEGGMALDGGGSATLWYDGQVRNSPCDRYERSVANSLVVARKTARLQTPVPSEHGLAGQLKPPLMPKLQTNLDHSHGG
jgi:hypothetical protein